MNEGGGKAGLYGALKTSNMCFKNEENASKCPVLLRGQNKRKTEKWPFGITGDCFKDSAMQIFPVKEMRESENLL